MRRKEMDEPIEEFKRILRAGEEIGNEIAEQGRIRTEKGQELADLSKSARKITESISPGQVMHGIEEAIEDWRYYVDRSKQERDEYSPFGVEYLTSASSVASIYSSDMFDDLEEQTPEPYKSVVTPAIDEYHEIFERSTNQADALNLLNEFGLDESYHNRRPATEQFIVAYDSLNRPVSGETDPAQTSLLPMREAIETALDQLFFMRPKRSNIGDVEGPNKDWRKVVAISSQLKKDEIPKNIIQSWARDWSNIKNKT